MGGSEWLEKAGILAEDAVVCLGIVFLAWRLEMALGDWGLLGEPMILAWRLGFWLWRLGFCFWRL
jgi:hypothetical protein